MVDRRVLRLSSEDLMLQACKKLISSLLSASRISVRFSFGANEDKAYFYSSKRYVYISISVKNSGAKSLGDRVAFLLILSSFSGVKGRIRLLATLLASIALLFLNGFVPLSTIVTLVMVVVAVALLVIAFVIARSLGRVSMDNEDIVERVHRRLYSVNLIYRAIFNSVKEFSARVATVATEVLKGKNPSSIHVPSLGIYRVKSKSEGEVVELELERVAEPSNSYVKNLIR